MQTSDPEWRQDLARDLKQIAGRYTPEKYPSTLETQREFQDALANLEMGYDERVTNEEKAERRGYDSAYRLKELGQLNDQERAAWVSSPRRDDLWAMREAQRGQRDELAADNPNPAYRQSDEYRDGLQQLVTEQAYFRDRMDQAFRTVEEGLNERFCFSRDREISHDDRDR